MAPIKHVPGAQVRLSGTYALVSQEGEAIGFAVQRKAGEVLPLVSVSAEYKSIWFVLMDAGELQAA